MSDRIELPNGGHAILRDPAAVTERQRRPVTRLQTRLAGGSLGKVFALKGKVSDEEFDKAVEALVADGDLNLDVIADLEDAGIVAVVESLSLREGLPDITNLTVDTLLDLPTATYDALKAGTAERVAKLTLDVEPSAEAVADPASPTEPSAA